jgi:hypothetical protein
VCVSYETDGAAPDTIGRMRSTFARLPPASRNAR